jgi:glycosyltransferase involved in cell wall biosynthesis
MTTTVVVPCFNEAGRIDLAAFSSLADRGDLGLVFVDDGSTDATFEVLRRLHQPTVEVIRFESNRGKAEAVRCGLQRAIESGADRVAYYDADLASPPAELIRLLGALDGEVDVVLGSRVALLGHHIRRRATRHYLGRVFATFASLVLRIPVYDTQCGLKTFRVTDSLRAAVAEPFGTRWAFDVELLQRLIDGGTPVDRIVEIPLNDWRDVAGSHVGYAAAFGAARDLAHIHRVRSRSAR